MALASRRAGSQAHWPCHHICFRKFCSKGKTGKQTSGWGAGEPGARLGQDEVRGLPTTGDHEAGRASGSPCRGSWGNRREESRLSPALAPGADLGQTQVHGLTAGPTSDTAHAPARAPPALAFPRRPCSMDTVPSAKL